MYYRNQHGEAKALPCPGGSCRHCPICTGRSPDGGPCFGCKDQAASLGITVEELQRWTVDTIEVKALRSGLLTPSRLYTPEEVRESFVNPATNLSVLGLVADRGCERDPSKNKETADAI